VAALYDTVMIRVAGIDGIYDDSKQPQGKEGKEK
jgi:hypothetical protein